MIVKPFKKILFPVQERFFVLRIFDFTLLISLYLHFLLVGYGMTFLTGDGIIWLDSLCIFYFITLILSEHSYSEDLKL